MSEDVEQGQSAEGDEQQAALVAEAREALSKLVAAIGSAMDSGWLLTSISSFPRRSAPTPLVWRHSSKPPEIYRTTGIARRACSQRWESCSRCSAEGGNGPCGQGSSRCPASACREELR